MNVHACFADCVITIDEAMRRMLAEGLPFSHFKNWFHAAILDPEWFDMNCLRWLLCCSYRWLNQSRERMGRRCQSR